jgi:mono/diheme cytochrome c family protein
MHVSRYGFLLAILVLAGVTASRISAAEDPKTILDRVFSVAQADRGQQRFRQSCSSCHTANEFAGNALSARWEGQSLGDLFEFISTAMPENDPGGLAPEEYASVIAFFLGQSAYPVGNDDLPVDKDVLSKIGIVPNPK